MMRGAFAAPIVTGTALDSGTPTTGFGWSLLPALSLASDLSGLRRSGSLNSGASGASDAVKSARSAVAAAGIFCPLGTLLSLPASCPSGDLLAPLPPAGRLPDEPAHHVPYDVELVPVDRVAHVGVEPGRDDASQAAQHAGRVWGCGDRRRCTPIRRASRHSPTVCPRGRSVRRSARRRRRGAGHGGRVCLPFNGWPSLIVSQHVSRRVSFFVPAALLGQLHLSCCLANLSFLAGNSYS